MQRLYEFQMQPIPCFGAMSHPVVIRRTARALRPVPTYIGRHLSNSREHVMTNFVINHRKATALMLSIAVSVGCFNAIASTFHHAAAPKPCVVQLAKVVVIGAKL